MRILFRVNIAIMPPEASPSTSIGAARRPWRRALRFSWLLLRILIIAFALLLLAVRLIVFPRLEQNRDELSRMLSSQIGQPVEIGALVTGWDGWNPRVDVRDFRVLDRIGGIATATLPDVRLVVAWTSLAALSLRLKELTISGAQFAIRRDASGMLHLAGMTIDPQVARDDRSFAEWLMRQPRIVVHGAQLVWRDERAGASELVLSQVELLLENQLGQHRFGLKGAPPEALAAPLDLRGDLSGPSLADWHALTGKIYARMDYADIAAWREWLPMRFPVSSGKGALRIWLDVANGDLRDLTADVVLSDVQARVAPELSELTLTRLEGRIGWSDDGKQQQFYTQHLSFAERDGARFEPTDVKVTMRVGEHGMDGGSVEFARLDLLPLREIAASLPLPAPWRDGMARFAPSGVLEGGNVQWEGSADAPSAISGSGRFVDLAIAAHEAWPGVTGLTGSVDASTQGGTLKFDGHAVVLDLHHALGERITLDTAQGAIRWHRENDDVRYEVDQLAFANKDLAGTAKGSYAMATGQHGRADLNVTLTRLDAKQVYHYVSPQIDDKLRKWLQTSVQGGSASDVRIRLVGALSDFPYADPKNGQFQLSGKVQAVALDYASGWPAIEDMDVDLRIDGQHLAADVQKGRIYGAEFGRSKFEVTDLGAVNPLLRIEGTVSGQARDFIRYLTDSPLQKDIGLCAGRDDDRRRRQARAQARARTGQAAGEQDQRRVHAREYEGNAGRWVAFARTSERRASIHGSRRHGARPEGRTVRWPRAHRHCHRRWARARGWPGQLQSGLAAQPVPEAGAAHPTGGHHRLENRRQCAAQRPRVDRRLHPQGRQRRFAASGGQVHGGHGAAAHRAARGRFRPRHHHRQLCARGQVRDGAHARGGRRDHRARGTPARLKRARAPTAWFLDPRQHRHAGC